MNLDEAAKLGHADWQQRAAGTEADINKAVAIAKASFKSGEWSRKSPTFRICGI